jgi:multicomponent Na+:H+ antiporter subunit D
MDRWVHPAIFFYIGSLLLPFMKGKARKFFILFIPVLSIIDVALMHAGTYGSYRFLNMNIVFGRVDKLSLVFAWVFVIMAFLGALYALHVKEDGHHIAGAFYVGSSLGAIFAGDYLTLFIFWEAMAFSSVFLVWYRKEKRSVDAGYRYLLMHVFGGLLFFTGMMTEAFTGKGSAGSCINSSLSGGIYAPILFKWSVKIDSISCWTC